MTIFFLYKKISFKLLLLFTNLKKYSFNFLNVNTLKTVLRKANILCESERGIFFLMFCVETWKCPPEWECAAKYFLRENVEIYLFSIEFSGFSIVKKGIILFNWPVVTQRKRECSPKSYYFSNNVWIYKRINLFALKPK